MSDVIRQPQSQRSMAPTMSTYGDGLDRFEGINAAEWDEDSEWDEVPERQEILPTRTLKLGKIESEKVGDTTNASIPALSTRSYPPVKDSLTPKKKATCWFWATPGKECRFTAEECRYLHAFLPTSLGEPHNNPPRDAPIHSQSSLSKSHPHPDPFLVSKIHNGLKERTKTCWFWANGGKCNYTAENCKYLHERTAETFPPRTTKTFSTAGNRAVDKYKKPYVSDADNWASGKLIKVVNLSELPGVETSPKIERCEFLTSYNWLDHPKYPTILVPGSPPLWSPSPSMNQLQEDSGEYFKDPNAARYPRYPTEPLFKALLTIQPDADLSSFDVVGCGSTLGNLLRFCTGSDKDFRFDIDRVKHTIFFIRKESSPTVLIPDVYGYGHSFPEAHTIWEPSVKGSVSHQRIIKYDFGVLKFLVRSESDGYLKQAVDLDPTENLEKTQEKSEIDSDGFFDSLKITEGSPPFVGPLRIEMGGRLIPQKAIFDLKTRAKDTYRPIDMDEVYRRLWVNQTPYFIFAEHFRGYFDTGNIKPVSISDELLKWEKDREALLKSYQAVMMEIIMATRNSATGKLQVIRRGSGSLEIQERVAGDDTDILPRDLCSKW